MKFVGFFFALLCVVMSSFLFLLLVLSFFSFAQLHQKFVICLSLVTTLGFVDSLSYVPVFHFIMDLIYSITFFLVS